MWLTILNGLSVQKSSIDGAATFLLERPEMAQKCFRALAGHLETVAASRRLAPLYVLHEVCQRGAQAYEEETGLSDGATDGSASFFVRACTPFLTKILASALLADEDDGGESGGDGATLAERVRPLVRKWEQRRLFASATLDEVRKLLAAASGHAERPHSGASRRASSSSRQRVAEEAAARRAASESDSPFSPSRIKVGSGPSSLTPPASSPAPSGGASRHSDGARSVAAAVVGCELSWEDSACGSVGGTRGGKRRALGQADKGARVVVLGTARKRRDEDAAWRAGRQRGPKGWRKHRATLGNARRHDWVAGS